MKTENCIITKISKVSSSVVSLSFSSDYFPENLKPGQFLNIKIDSEKTFLLRRPFSVSDIGKSEVTILFNIVGKGTFALSEKKTGDTLNILGPLGNGFKLDSDFDHALILGGGIGVAPFPFLIHRLQAMNKKISVFFGFRSKVDVIDFGFDNTHYSTDDGSIGFKGNVNDLFLSQMNDINKKSAKIFACGPNIMLKNLAKIASDSGFDAEISIESYMACGIGICQGCPVESGIEENKYHLVCKDGPCFNIKEIKL